MTLKRILVATDMSPRSDRAALRAFDLGRTLDLPVTLLMILDDAMPADLTDVLHAQAELKIDKFVAANSGGANVDTIVRTGDPTEEILSHAHNDPDCLLVMGVHRPRLFLDSLRETTMQRIVRRTANPVLLVKDPVDHSYKHVAGACDFSPASTAAVALALSLTPGAKARLIHALQVPYGGTLGQVQSAAAELEKAFLKEARHNEAVWRATTDLPEGTGETEITIGAPFTLLRKLVEEDNVDLIAVGAHGRVGAARAILGSLSVDLMRNPPCDVLIARP